MNKNWKLLSPKVRLGKNAKKFHNVKFYWAKKVLFPSKVTQTPKQSQMSPKWSLSFPSARLKRTILRTTSFPLTVCRNSQFSDMFVVFHHNMGIISSFKGIKVHSIKISPSLSSEYRCFISMLLSFSLLLSLSLHHPTLVANSITRYRITIIMLLFMISSVI